MAEQQPRPKSRGVATTLLALLSLAALALAGYVFWRVEWANPVTAVEVRWTDRFATLRAELDAARTASEADMAARINELDKATGQQRDALDGARDALVEAIAAGRRAAPPDARDWKIAEVEYLLRVANNRLFMERDAVTAERLLGAADGILEELDDYAFFEVRALLAEERLALRETSTSNAQTLFLRLEALKDGLGGLPGRVPEYFGARDAATPASSDEDPASQSAWQALLDRLSGLYEFRTRDGIAPRPLLRADEGAYLEFNLRLAFERAQLAALRHDQFLYGESLQSARAWVDEHLDAESAAVQALRQELDALLQFNVEAPLPDISKSLARLRALAPAALTPAPEPDP